MAMSTGGRKGIKNEINITPLVDVVLVLLIIFMVVTPMLQRGKDVRLPKSHTTDEENKEGDPIILSLTKDKTIYIESSAFTQAKVEDELARILKATPGRKILLKGDASLTVMDVRKAMDIARKAKAKSIALGVEELKEE
jgi:biopolymer transport protein TolR